VSRLLLLLFSFSSFFSSSSSKIEAGLLRLEVAPHNLLEVVETATLLCVNLATTKGLDIGWFVDPSLPPLLNIDSTRVQQCLLNLLSNGLAHARTAIAGTSIHWPAFLPLMLIRSL